MAGTPVPPETDRGPSVPRRVLGLDEAGRGSVLGPLVLGGFLCEATTVDRLAPIGVRDSKLLTPARRRELHEALGRMGRRLWVAFPPDRIDRAVDRHGLNRLEAEGFAALVRRARPDLVVLDACEVDARRFGREVADRADFHGPIDARNHADRDLPVVGAASIVAKVRRDAAIARIAHRLDDPIGSGYPSDPRTRAYLTRVLRPGASRPPWVRASWRTTATIMAARGRTTLETYAP